MSSTLEEREATVALEAAIERYRVAYQKSHPESTQGTLTDWVIIAAEVTPNMEDPTDDVTSYSTIMSGGGMPWHRVMGLLEAGRFFLNHGMQVDR